MPSKISRTRCDWIGNCCLAGFAAGRPGQAEFGHQPLDGATGGAAWRIRTALGPNAPEFFQCRWTGGAPRADPGIAAATSRKGLHHLWSCRPLVPTDHSFNFIRSASAAPLVSRVLNPQDWSSSSSLTSMNVWLLTSPQLHTRKVAGSIPAGTTSRRCRSGTHFCDLGGLEIASERAKIRTFSVSGGG